MGKPSTTASDKAIGLLTGSFTANGNSGTVQLHRAFNFAVWGTYSAVAFLERSFDGGTIWFQRDTIAGLSTVPSSWVHHEPEDGVLYRVRCGSYASGTLNWR